MKTNIKKIILLMVVIILIEFSNSRIIYSLDKSINEDICYEEILSINLITNNSKIDYSLRNNGKSILRRAGIETFTVDDKEKIYLSNFATGKIIVYYKNKFEQEIDISNFYQPRDIGINNDLLYIFEDQGKIREIFLEDGRELNEYDIPTMIKTAIQEGNKFNKTMPIRLVNNYQDKQISVLYDTNFLNLFRSGEKKEINMDKFKLNLKGQIYKQLIGIDEQGYIYILGTEVRDKNDKIEIKERIYRFNNTGKLFGIADTVDEKNYIVPFKYLDINKSGDVFQLLVKKNKLKVFKLKFKENSDLKVLEAANKTQDMITIDNFSSVEDKYLAVRKNLYNKAIELINLKWTYDPKSNTNKLSDVVTPIYLKKIKEKREMTGIPYCWGGYDSLKTKSKSQKWDNFVDAVSKGAIVGNVGVTLNYVPRTTGLDCSGLISVVLDLDSREPSWKFLYSSQLAEKITYNQLALMDMLVKNGHMFFYVNKNNYGITSIETNTVGSQWKVKFFNWSWRALRDMNYSARRYKGLSRKRQMN
ncbi:hypothetical protein [Halocella sp. SP3-1]|uniref:hypothetical protein n=1 Tax=Halocella sp. SP3-1 TaxID=2382161 RepID=UPI000F756657|nr:hypothetical protein [Halocella sp. SP3-1]AZO95073.1 hypothetical protein D7D81_10990 [Halocella sp. SP3-1]